MEIKRGYSRKVNLGNYESEDIWAARSIEVPDDTPLDEAKKISEDLFTLSMTDVERDKRKMEELRGDGKISPTKLKEMLEKVAEGRPILLEDYENLTPAQNGQIQDKKREYKRKQYAERKEANEK
jgi:hypothetical protein